MSSLQHAARDIAAASHEPCSRRPRPLIGAAAVRRRAADRPARARFHRHGQQGQHRTARADFRGKTVVLEWTNADCPYTRKHYTSGNMQSLQTLAREERRGLADA